MSESNNSRLYKMTAVLDLPTVVDNENGNQIPEEKPPKPLFIFCMNLINTLTHLVLGGVIMIAIFFANIMPSGSSLSAHIYLCVTGYLILMSQAVLTLNPHNGWSHSLATHQKRIIHWIMQITGSSLAIVGSIIRIADRENHFGSAHGILGILALSLTILSLLGGVINLLFVVLSPKIIRIFHATIGTLTLVAAYLCLIFAFHKTFYRQINGDTNANIAVSLTVFALLGTVISSCMNIFKRIFS